MPEPTPAELDILLEDAKRDDKRGAAARKKLAEILLARDRQDDDVDTGHDHDW